MVPCPDAVNILAASLFAQLLCHTLGNAVDAPNGGHNPYLVAYADIAVLAYVTLKSPLLVLDVVDVALGVHRLIGILQRSAEVRLEVVLVHPVAGLHVLTGVSDGVTILDNVLTLLDILDEYFVACGSVLVQDYLLAIDVNHFAFLLRLQADDNRVGGVNFKECC